MKLRYLSCLLLFFLFVQHSSEQGFNFNPSNLRDGDVPPSNEHLAAPERTVPESANSGGLVGTLRNTTSILLQRLEAPRDRVLEFIRPAVRSEFSRNVTNLLNSIWSRVQEANVSLIQHPLVRTSIVRPINTTLERLKLVTAPEEAEHAELSDSNVEVLNLNRPEGEEPQADYVVSSASEDVTGTPILLILESERNERRADEISNDDDASRNKPVDDNAVPVDEPQQPAAEKPNEELVEKPNEEPVESPEPTELPKSAELPKSTEDEDLNPTKSRRAARFMDNYYVTPSRVRNLFDNVRGSGMQECMALALCESHCRPHLYESYSGGRRGFLSRLFDRFEQPALDHPDSAYYMDARRYGQQYYDGDSRNDCSMCHAKYYCPHERAYMMNRFSSMGNF